MTRSSEDIEREVEATRGNLDRTVEALKERMTPGQLVDEVMDAMGGPVQEMASNLGAQVRANPVPLALIGAGVAWLVFGRGHREGGYRERRSWRSSDADYEFEPDYAGAPQSGYLGMDYDPNTVGQEGDTRGRVRRVKQAAGRGADRAKQAMSSARSAMSERAEDARQRAGQFADTARQRASDYSQRARDIYEDTLDRDPLLIGALGVAVGAAIGAAIPATPLERRYVGPLRDKAWEEGRVRARQAMDQGKEVAKAAVDSVREEAHRQGVTNLAGLVDKAEQVARAGVDTVKREVETRTH